MQKRQRKRQQTSVTLNYQRVRKTGQALSYTQAKNQVTQTTHGDNIQ